MPGSPGTDRRCRGGLNMPEPTQTREILKIGPDARSNTADEIAVEEPLEIRVAGEPVAITMRTPGSDTELVAGFLLSEGIITSLGDVSRIYHCGRPGTEAYHNTVDVIPAAGHALDVADITTSKRGTLTTAACGVCGRKSIDDLIERCQPFGDVGSLEASQLLGGVESLRDQQPTFDKTGGVHAAGIFSDSGELLVCREDIGRHNAVDKAVGTLLYQDAWPAEAQLLAVSGRASFEMVQKAAMARLPFLASVSAASSLAINLAEQIGITLAGFVRGNRMNIYTHPQRVTK
jgi:FdhD protein